MSWTPTSSTGLPRHTPKLRRQVRRNPKVNIEFLEERLMLTGGAAPSTLPAAIVVGRTLSSYTLPGLSGNQVTLTYNVYNQHSDPETGVVLTTTLQPGVSVASTSAPPNQNGQTLAWSLGTIPGYGRASVSVTVSLGSSLPTQLDGGAAAFATLDGGKVSDTAPAAALVNRAIAPALLASTPDANTTDPFIQEKAAELDYDPRRIYDFLHDEIGYEAYAGSVRGARGTLWSGAGNALDVASLGVALMRTSGIPAQYAEGSLSDATTGQLIQSMFPAQSQTVGFLPAGSPTYDPAQDATLRSLTRTHDWFQFDTGGGMTDADPLLSAAAGQKSAAVSSTFTSVPDALREKTRIQLVAEITNTASQLFGVAGQSTTTVIDQTFNDVDLVGRPITIGNFVTSSTTGFVFSATTNTYTPYLNLGDLADPEGSGDVRTGTPYQEVLTNFPFGTQALTGLFLNVTLSGPQGADEIAQSVLYDRLGYAARLGLQAPAALTSDGTPALSDVDLYTLFVQPGRLSPNIPRGDLSSIGDVLSTLSDPSFQNLPSDVMVQRFMTAMREAYTNATRVIGTEFLRLSDSVTDQLAQSALVKAYFSRPRLIIASNRSSSDANSISGGNRLGLDLLRDRILALPFPGQDPGALVGFLATFGVTESRNERDAMKALVGVSSDPIVNVPDIMTAAVNQAIEIVVLKPGELAALEALSISIQAKARIKDALNQGNTVVVPSSTVDLDGVKTVGWYQINPQTGETISVGENGQHPSLVFWSGLAIFSILIGALEVVNAIQCYAPLQQQYEINRVNWGDEAAAKWLLAKIIECEKETHEAAGKLLLKVAELFWSVVVSLFKAATTPPPSPPPTPPVPRRRRRPRGRGRQTVESISTLAAAQTTALASPPGWTTNPVKLVQSYIEGQYVNLGPAINPLSSVQAPPLKSANLAGVTLPVTHGSSAGAVQGNRQASFVQVAGSIAASWSSLATTGMSLQSLSTAAGVIRDSQGHVVGSGSVSLSDLAGALTAVSGQVAYNLKGTGTLGFQTSSSGALGVGADWDSFTANLSGTIRLQLTTAGLTVGGAALPAGTYTIDASAVQLAGSGNGISPSFSDPVSIAAESAAIEIGSGDGVLSVGGSVLDPSRNLSLTGYSGAIRVSAATSAIGLAMNGTASSALGVAAATIASADQNTPAVIVPVISTSLDGEYSVTATGPEGWTVTVDSQGKVLARPAPGVQSGSYPIRIVVQSPTDDDLVTQTTVQVNVTATQPGETLSVAFDDQLGVPYQGSYLPTGYRATIQNLGPAADTYRLTFTGIPAGFMAITSTPQITVPAGGTGVVGIYLVPTGATLPPPGTVISFGVTSTSTSDGSITKTQTVSSTLDVIEAVTIRPANTDLTAIPGQPSTVSVTVTNAGNIEEDVTFDSDFDTGLTIDGFPPMTLQPGESRTLNLTITPAPSIPLGSIFAPSIEADFGPADDPYADEIWLSLKIVAPGVKAIDAALTASGQLGNAALSDRLNDLSTSLTNLFTNPSDPVARSQALASLDAIAGQLGADPIYATVIPELTAARGLVVAAASVTDVTAAIDALGVALNDYAAKARAQAAHQFELSLLNNTQIAQPGAAAMFSLQLQNTGTATTTYLLSLEDLSPGLTGSVSQASVILAPGQVTTSLSVRITPDTSVDFDSLGFVVRVTAQDAPEITRTTNGGLTARQEFVSITSVTTDPPFTMPGGKVEVTAQILNAVNKVRPARASYVLKNSGGNVVQTSTAVAFTLTVKTTLTTVDLGPLDTTGLAQGTYTIDVSLTDADGHPIPGGTGTGPLLVGSPVGGSITLDRDTLPGSGTVTTTLQVTSQQSLVGPLGVLSQTDLPGASAVTRNGNYVYASGSSSIGVFDVTDPTSPTHVTDFGSSASQLQIHGGKLYAMTRGGNTGRFSVRIYSLTDPSHPQLLGSARYTDGVEGIPYSNAWHMTVTDTDVFVSIWSFSFLTGSNDIRYQTGDIIAIDVSDPTAPVFASALKNTYGTNNDGIGQFLNVDNTGGDGPEWEIRALDHNTLLVAGSTVKGDNTQDGQGIVQVVDVSDPAHMKIVNTLVIPNTVQAVGLSVDGDRAFVTGSTTGWEDGASMDFTGQTVLAVLDVSDHQNPVLLSHRTVDRSSRGYYDLYTTPLGNGLFVFSSDYNPTSTLAPALFVVDAHDPLNLAIQSTSIPAVTSDLYGSGNLVYTTSSSGLIIYQLDAPDSIPVTATVHVPHTTGVSIVPGSFSIQPTQIVSGPTEDTILFNLSLTADAPSQTITWQTTVSDLQPAEVRQVVASATLDFTSQATQGEVPLGPLSVTGEQLLTLDPDTQTAAPGEAVGYTLHLRNPTSGPLTYTLAIQGVPGSWSSLPSQVTVAAGATQDIAWSLSSEIFAPLGSHGFTVLATSGGIHGAVGSELVLAGTPVVADADAHGVVVTLTPNTASAGQGTLARYTLHIVNTGSAAETYRLTLVAPTGISSISFPPTVTLAPGTLNAVDVPLVLIPSPGTSPGPIAFSVSAVSTADFDVSSRATGTLKVLAGGVQVALTPSAGNPGAAYNLTVLNTGSTPDTFDLALGGPAALIATLGGSQVDLGPGESRIIPIRTGAVDFALHGSLGLVAMATSHTDSTIRSAARADLNIDVTAGFHAVLNPSTVTLESPGETSLGITVNNTGNIQGAFSMAIVGTSGPIVASLIGLDGQPTQSISQFLLTGLSSGLIPLRATLTGPGSGTVDIQIISLATGQTVTVTARVSAQPSLPAAGPKVVQVQRYGIHMMPTKLVVTFDQPLDPTRAQDVRAYHLRDPRGRLMPIRKAVYDPAANTVTLYPASRINLHQRYTITVDGASARGLIDTQGRLLDGNADGIPGGNYVAPITWRDLVIPPGWKTRKTSHPASSARRTARPTPHTTSSVPRPAARFRLAAAHPAARHPGQVPSGSVSQK